MWNFLAEGKSGATATEMLADLVLELQNLRGGGLSGHPQVAANAYMLWAEKAEELLRDQFESAELARGLQTERYWQIRNISQATARPMPLILAEADEQERRLRAIHSQLRDYSTRLRLTEGGWLLVFDTHVLIHGRLFDQVEWHRAFDVPRVTIVVTLVVLDELDKIKDRDPNYGRRAKSVLRALDKVTAGKKMLDPVTLRTRVTLQLLGEPRGHWRQQSQDDEIIRQAEYFARLNEGRLLVLTRDRGMLLRAQAAELESRLLPAELERIQENDS
jgi:hypothetical protein